MFRPPSDTDGVPCPIEFIGTGYDGLSTEIDSGWSRRGRRPSSGSGRKWALAVAGAVIIVAFVFGDRQQRHTASPSLGTVPATAPAAALPSSSPPHSATAIDAPTVAAAPTPSVSPATTAFVDSVPVGSAALTSGPVGSGPPAAGPAGSAPVDFASETPIGVPARGAVYLFNEGSGPSLARLDLQTGALQVFDDPPRVAASDRVVAMTSRGADAVPIWERQLGDSGVWAQCSDGTVWIVQRDGGGHLTGLQRLRVHPGAAPEVVQVVNASASLRQMRSDTLGTTADDRPVVTAPNGRAYVLDPLSGALTRLSDGMVVSVQRGWYAETVCVQAAACGLVLHGAGPKPVPLAGTVPVNVSFSPDGFHALVLRSSGEAKWTKDGFWSNADLRLIDLRSGAVADIHGSVQPDEYSNPESATWAAWSADGTEAAYGTSNGVGVVDVPTATFQIVAAPASSPGPWTTVGLT